MLLNVVLFYYIFWLYLLKVIIRVRLALFFTFYNFGGVFRAQLNICGDFFFFCVNSWWLKAVNCFCKWFWFWYFIRLWIRLGVCFKAVIWLFYCFFFLFPFHTTSLSKLRPLDNILLLINIVTILTIYLFHCLLLVRYLF